MPLSRRGWPWAFGGIGLLCFAAAAVLGSTYFVVSDTSCALFRWNDWSEVCRPTMQRWAIVVVVLVALGLASVTAGVKMVLDSRR